MSSESLHPGLIFRRTARQGFIHLPAAFPIALVLAAVMSLLYLNQASIVATTGYEVRRLETEREQWLIRNQQARLKLDEMRSLDRISDEARKAGLGPPGKRLFVTRGATTAEWVTSPALAASQSQLASEASENAAQWDRLASDALGWLGAQLQSEPKTSR